MEYNTMKMSFGDVGQAANELIQAGEGYIENVKVLYQIIDNLEENWKGEDNQNYVTTVNSYKDDIMTLGTVVKQYGMFLEGSKNIISETQDDITSRAGRLQ